MSKIYDVLILGAGPGGLAAGLYAGRARLSTLIVEKGQDGGQIAITDSIENYPGQIVEGESGPSLIKRMTEQAEHFGCDRVHDTIKSVELEGDVKRLVGVNGTYEGKTLIIAEHRLNYLRSVIDRVVYLKGGRIMQEFTAAQFRALTERERISMGLRTIKETQITIPECTVLKGELCIERIISRYKEEEISFGANSGDVIGIVGKNGAGKTTLCKIICGLLKEQSGTVSYQGKKLTRRQRQRLCAMVMQDVNHQLFTDSVVEECELAAPEASKEKIDKLLQGFDLLPYKEVHPAVLSGGQRQRLAVCQAVLSGKKLVIFDEPTSGLDYKHMMQTGEIIQKLSHEGYIVLVITHDYEFLNLVCHSVIQLGEQSAVKGGMQSEEAREEKEKKLV